MVALLAVLVGAPGCASWEAARHHREGRAALAAGDGPRAVAELERAVALRPDVSALHNELGLAWLGAGDEQAAMRSFERAVELDCENRAARANLAALELRLERRDARERVAAERNESLPVPARPHTGATGVPQP